MAVGSLESLLARTNVDDHEAILAAANNVLQKSKNDIAAQHVRVVALLKLDRFEDALKAFESADAPLKKDAALEHAYTLYKNGRPEEAKTLAESDSSRGLRHVEAQADYRLEHFSQASEIYGSLALHGQDEAGDLRVNTIASDAQLCWANLQHLAKLTNSNRDDLDQFETAYNAACRCLARREFKQASILLSRAKDRDVELLPIVIQQSCVLLQMGRVADARALLAGINLEQWVSRAEGADFRRADAGLRRLVGINTLVANADHTNPYYAHREFSSLSAISEKDKAFRFQQEIVKRDQVALDLLVGKSPPVPDHASVDFGISNAAAVSRGKQVKEAIHAVLCLLETRPNDIGLLLVALHLYLRSNNTQAAITLLERHFVHNDYFNRQENLDLRYAPGLISLYVSLNASLHRSLRSRQELANVAEFWKGHDGNTQDIGPVFVAAGSALLDSSISQSRDIFQHLAQLAARSDEAVAGLAATSTDSKEDGYVELQPTKKVIAGIDVDRLESGGVAKAPEVSEPPPSKKRATEAMTTPKANKRSRRIPKTANLAKEPDPERWLPARDRSSWKPPKGKKKGKAAAQATQGGVVTEDGSGTSATPAPQLVQAKSKKKGKR